MQTAADKLRALREQIKSSGLHGYMVPQTDEYQNEFVPPAYQRLGWQTGFTGSAGIAIIMDDRAVVMTDGRYTIQVREEIDAALYGAADSTQVSIAGWLKDNANGARKIGYDPKLFTFEQIAKLENDLADTDLEVVSIENNLIDAIWADRPAPPCSNIEIFPHEIADMTAAEKIQKIANAAKQNDVDAVFLSAPESVCWLLNIRGQDTPCTPLVLSEVLVRADGTAQWFIDAARVSDDVRAHIGDVEITSGLNIKNVHVMLDLKRSALSWKIKLENLDCTVVNEKDPCVDLRAQKTATEIKAIKATHIQDGKAVSKLLRWVDEHQGTGITELDVAAKIDELRGTYPAYRGESFNCIAGMGANGAIIHYRPTAKTNKRIEGDGLLLIDCGGQYAGGSLYGTTDITRTVPIGTPSDEMKEMFTRVLKGHIALATAVFPHGTTGKDIDVLARASLKETGVDYAHGTGHGVGCYLSVHEEAASISWRGETPLEVGMLLSNEPGYYKEGAYGIRIENLVLVVRRDDGMLGFETVTLAPIDERLIKQGMLSIDEKAWLDDYHARVNQAVSDADNL